MNSPSILNARDEEDLRWLLQSDFEGAVGVKSNFGPMLNRLEENACLRPADPESWHTLLVKHPTPYRVNDVDEKAFVAASRLRRLSWMWDRLEPADRDTLRHVFAETRAAPREWGSLWWVVRKLPIAVDAHRRAKVKADIDHWLTRVPTRPAAAELAARLRRAADLQLAVASKAWLIAADEWRRAGDHRAA